MKIPPPIYRIIAADKFRLKQQALYEETIPYKELKKKQFNRFKKIFTHAYQNIPFYRQIYSKANIKPNLLKQPKDILKVPIVTKNEMRKVNIGLLTDADALDKYGIMNKTSGSTGKPFIYYNDSRAKKGERKALFRLQNAIGMNFGEKIIRLRNDNIKGVGLKIILQKAFGNTIHLSTRNLTLQLIDKHIARIRRINPRLIESFPHQILAFVKRLEETGDTLPVPNILIVGGNLTKKDKMRVSAVFKGKIFNEYGASEAMRVAYQCNEGSAYHIDLTRYHVEVIRNGREADIGERGELVITNFDNRVMPFIRYRIKDVAIRGEKCNCHRTWPTLERVEGRVQQTMLLPNGRFLEPNLIRETFTNNAEIISEFQSVLTSENELLIKIVPHDAYEKSNEMHIISELEKITGPNIPIRIEKVKSIPRYGNEQKIMDIMTERPPNLLEV